MTAIENLEEIQDTKIYEVNMENPYQTALDLTFPIEKRLEAVKLYYEKYEDKTIEILRSLINIFNMSGSISILREYITILIEKDILPFHLRFELAKDFCVSEETEGSFILLLNLCDDFPLSYDVFSIPKRVEAILTLMRSRYHRIDCRRLFLKLLSTYSFTAEYRYKLILSLKSNFNLRKSFLTSEERKIVDSDLYYYEKEFLEFFVSDKNNTVQMRILAGQLLLINYDSEIGDDTLLNIANDVTVEYNCRADATDVLLQYSKKYKDIAKDIINRLGNIEIGNTIYNNAQNAHTKEIEKSALETLSKLSLLYRGKEENILDKLRGMDLNDKVKSTLNRISLDNAYYTYLKISLKDALTYSYLFIQDHSLKDLLWNRLLEELGEASDICSTGIMERIMNVFTGIDDLGIRISFEDQIIGNLSGRLNKRIRDIVNEECLHLKNIVYCDCNRSKCMKSDHTPEKCDDCTERCIHLCGENCDFNERYSERVLNEMTIDTKNYHLRRSFLLFFRNTVSDIMDEIKEEFLEHISCSDFDLYFRKAIQSYEGYF